MQGIFADQLDFISSCDVDITWLSNVRGSLRRDVRPAGTDVTKMWEKVLLLNIPHYVARTTPLREKP
jgi:hypothetical protein